MIKPVLKQISGNLEHLESSSFIRGLSKMKFSCRKLKNKQRIIINQYDYCFVKYKTKSTTSLAVLFAQNPFWIRHCKGFLHSMRKEQRIRSIKK
jgi:hypothetical protein